MVSSWRPADWIDRVTLAVAGDQDADGVGRQRGFGKESQYWASCDEVGVVLLGVGGDQDHPTVCQAGFSEESPSEVKSALATEVDVEQDGVRPQLDGLLEGLSTGRRDA